MKNKSMNTFQKLVVDNYIKNYRKRYPNSVFDTFRAKNGELFIISSSHYMPDVDVNGVLRNPRQNVRIKASKIDCLNFNLREIGRVNGKMYSDLDCAYLNLIALDSQKDAHIGLGSKMLNMFEQTTKNFGIHNISGYFCPCNITIADDEQVRSFYEKNNYSFAEYPFFNGSDEMLFKSYDENFSEMPVIKNLKEKDEERYILLTQPITEQRRRTFDQFISDTFECSSM